MNESRQSPIRLVLAGEFDDEAAVRAAVQRVRLCFDHDPLIVRDGTKHLIQVGFQLNLYAAFQDPHHFPGSDERESAELSLLLGRVCRVLAHTVEGITPCSHPEPVMRGVVYAPERGYRAEVRLHVQFEEQPIDGEPPVAREGLALAAVEAVLLAMGARRGVWEVPSEHATW
ncbi:MAG: hypothetical protein U0172_11845 [Nitrospiraceae bacterium]